MRDIAEIIDIIASASSALLTSLTNAAILVVALPLAPFEVIGGMERSETVLLSGVARKLAAVVPADYGRVV